MADTPTHKHQVGASFDRAASVYDEMATFQHQVCERLASTLPVILPEAMSTTTPVRILDAGCGTGVGSSLLRQRWPHALVVGCDLSLAMARRASTRGAVAVCGDLERLPFADGSFDVVWSSLALQWCQPEVAYAELHRVLRSGGVLVFSTLGPGTLHELESAFAGIDTHRRVLPFVPTAQVHAALVAAGFAHSQLSSEPWVTLHSDFKTLLASIRGIGANQIGGNRRQGLMGKQAWQAAQARYEVLRDDNGLLPATYAVTLGWARKAA